MRFDSEEILIKELCGNQVDFYLEDDMFEIEGAAVYEDGKILVHVHFAVRHVLQISGRLLELQVNNGRLYAKRVDTGKVFEMEINRIYKGFENPSAEDFLRMNKNGVEQFFKKLTDTLVWFDNDQNKWVIEINKINMFSNGERTAYEKAEDLFESNKEQMSGVWQAVLYSADVIEGDDEGWEQ